MSTLEQRCFATSAVAHAAVVGLLAAASLIASRHPIVDPQALPPIELISLEGVKVTDGQGAGGGTPVPAQTPPTQTPTAPPPPPPATPRTEVRVTKTPTVPAATPAKPVDKPVDKPSKPETGIKVSSMLVKAQDTDTAVKTGPKVNTSRAVKVAAAPKGPTAAELAAEAAAERAEQEARERAAREATERWKNAVGGIRSQLAQGLSGQTEISVPGPGGGGEVWIGYGTYLKSFYEARWRRPSSLPVPVAYVGVAITVARDGRLVRFELLEKSGIKSLDDSVMDVISRYRTLERLPAGSTDPERTFRIKFRLEGTQ
jgi:outer membrane biosynthesis protein TonB